jgi:hypothetical protein
LVCDDEAVQSLMAAHEENRTRSSALAGWGETTANEAMMTPPTSATNPAVATTVWRRMLVPVPVSMMLLQSVEELDVPSD